MKRVIISNIVCSNSVSKIASIIGGIPGHSIEDVNVGDIYNPNRGGGTKEMASIHVVGFRVGPSRPIADTKIDHADHRSL